MPSRTQITRTSTFESLDIDSLDLVELAQIVEDEYGVQLKGEDMESVKTVGRPSTWWCRSSDDARVVITGVGAVTPLGVGARTLHERWSAGESGIEDGFGRASEFEPKEHLSTKEVRRADRFTQLALAAAAEAIEDAGWDGRPALRPGPRRLRDRHRHRRHRHARGEPHHPAATRARSESRRCRSRC